MNKEAFLLGYVEKFAGLSSDLFLPSAELVKPEIAAWQKELDQRYNTASPSNQRAYFLNPEINGSSSIRHLPAGKDGYDIVNRVHLYNKTDGVNKPMDIHELGHALSSDFGGFDRADFFNNQYENELDASVRGMQLLEPTEVTEHNKQMLAKWLSTYAPGPIPSNLRYPADVLTTTNAIPGFEPHQRKAYNDITEGFNNFTKTNNPQNFYWHSPQYKYSPEMPVKPAPADNFKSSPSLINFSPHITKEVSKGPLDQGQPRANTPLKLGPQFPTGNIKPTLKF